MQAGSYAVGPSPGPSVPKALGGPRSILDPASYRSRLILDPLLVIPYFFSLPFLSLVLRFIGPFKRDCNF